MSHGRPWGSNTQARVHPPVPWGGGLTPREGVVTAAWWLGGRRRPGEASQEQHAVWGRASSPPGCSGARGLWRLCAGSNDDDLFIQRLKIDSGLQLSGNVRPGAGSQGRTAPGPAGRCARRLRWPAWLSDRRPRGRLPADTGFYLQDASPSGHLRGGGREGHPGKLAPGSPPAPHLCTISLCGSLQPRIRAGQQGKPEGRDGAADPRGTHGTGAVVLPAVTRAPAAHRLSQTRLGRRWHVTAAGEAPLAAGTPKTAQAKTDPSAREGPG